MLPGRPRRLVRGLPVVLVALVGLAACSQPTVEPSPSASPTTAASPTTGPTVEPTEQPTPEATADQTTGPTPEPTPDDTLVLAGQFTAFVGADGSGPACNAFWWADALGGQPYVGLSDGREVTAAGRVEPLCLLGFDGQVELTVTDPAGEVRTVPVDATSADGGVGLLEVRAPRSDVVAVPVAWQASPRPVPAPSDGDVLAQDATEPTPTVSPADDQPTTTASEEPSATESEATEDVLDADGVRIEWAVPDDARGDYTFTARQGDREASAVLRVVAPTRLEVGPEAEGVRVVTLVAGSGEPVPVGLYRKPDVADLVATDGYRGKAFDLVTDLGTIAPGDTVVVDVSDLGFGHWCVISPAVGFVDCQADAPGSSGWTQ